MAVLPTTHPTLLDLAQQSDPGGKIEKIAEILSETNPILDTMAWVEGNLPTGHRTTIRTGLPKPTWRRFNQGVQPTKGTAAQITATTGMLEAYAEVDKALADLNGNTAEFRLGEDSAHIEGMNIEMASTLFYGNEQVDVEKFTGFAAHYNTKSAANSDNLLDAGGTGADNASIWLVVWAPQTCHGIIPKNSTAGLQMDDKGQVTVENVDGNGGRMEAYRTHYRWDAGLVVKDWRYVVRIANIPRGALQRDPANGGPDLPELMIDALERIDNLSRGQAVFYMDRSLRGFMRHQIKNSTANSTLSVETIAGRRVAYFDEVRVDRIDALAVNEARVV